MPHADLLAALLPPVSYAPSGPHLAASLAMEGRELDRVQADAAHAVGGLRPFLYQQWLEDYERVYGLPGPCALGGQLLQERLALLAVACWLQNLARRNGMFLLPMLFMLLVTLSALVLGIVAQGRALLAGTGGAVAALQLVIAVLLLALSLVLVHEGWQALRRKGSPAAEKA